MVQVGVTNGGRSTKSSCIGCDPTSVVVTLLTNYGVGKRGKGVLGMAASNGNSCLSKRASRF